MSDVREDLAGSLRRASERLRGEKLPGNLPDRLDALAESVYQPCVVAVVGRVKVGKSTFVNALLGEDLARVGTTETTATVNYFSYGNPDPGRPVRCHWRGGQVTDEDRTFLDSLQGNDLETLRRADGIDRLEYFLPNPLLRQITLVDTPGTGAVVEEHVERTAEFMRLNDRLRERHDEETRRLGETADAAIYLVGQVARTTDREFLSEFARATGGYSSALNAIGVLSKIELQPEVMARRHELAAKIASQLEDGLNAVIPAAAGLRRALDQLEEGALVGMAETLRRIPPETLRVLLDDPELFGEMDLPDSPVGPAERRELMRGINWGVFTVMAPVLADPELDFRAARERLEEMTGFGPLWEVLDRHFMQRGHILRCYRIAGDAREVLNDIRYIHLPELRRTARRDGERLETFLGFIRQAGGDRKVAEDLEGFVRGHLDVDRRADALERLHAQIEADLGLLFNRLLEHNEDFEVLQKLEADGGFTSAELAELRPLLGMYGGEVEERLPPGAANARYVAWRQMYWRRRCSEAVYGTTEHEVSDRAYTRYGLILDGLLDD